MQTHKIEIKPNNKQTTFLLKSCGTRRFSYNMALDLWNKEYLAGNKPNMLSVKKIINATKPKWAYDVSKCCVDCGVMDLGKGFNNYFKNPKHFKHPTFKRKGEKDSFRLDNEKFHITGNKLKIAKMKTPLNRWQKSC